MVENEFEKMKTIVLQFPILKEFHGVFPDEIPGLPLKRDLEFTIDLMLRYAPISQAPCRMSIPELTEVRMQLQELLDKKCIRPSVS